MFQKLRKILELLKEINKELRDAIAAYKEFKELVNADNEAEAVGKIHDITGTVSDETAEMKDVLEGSQ